MTGQPVKLERDGSAIHVFLVGHALGGWTRPVRVRIGARAFRRSGQPDVGIATRLAHLVAGRALAEHLFREGLLPEGDELGIDEVNPALLAAGVREAAGG